MGKDKTILVTGAAGFIASHIVDQFIEGNYKVVGLDSLKNGNVKNINKKLIFEKVDLNNPEQVKKILQKYKPATIIHQASNLVDVELSIDNPSLAYQDLIMTTNLIEEAYRNGLKHIMFSSSANAYGNQEHKPVKESATLLPTSPYGLTKIAIENYIQYFCLRHKINYTIFRYFNVYGERQNINSGAAIPTFVRHIIKNENVIISGGSQVRDFVYVKDVAKANFLAGTKDFLGIYNVGNGKKTRINDVITKIEKILVKKAIVTYITPDLADSQFSQASVAKLKRIFSWKPETSLDEGLKNTINYYLSDINEKV